MVVRCPKCHRLYDDAKCWTICDHGPLWERADAYCREHDMVNCDFHKGDKQTLTLSMKISPTPESLGVQYRCRWGPACTRIAAWLISIGPFPAENGRTFHWECCDDHKQTLLEEN